MACRTQTLIDAVELAIERLEINNCEGEEDEHIATLQAALNPKGDA